MTRSIHGLAAAALVAATACSTAARAAPAGPPDWLSGEDSSWPTALYLLGVGQADDAASAAAAARGEIARSFRSRVVSTTTALASEQTTTASGLDGAVAASSRRDDASTSDDTTVATDQQLVGVQIAATWRDPVTARFAALAVLDRREAATRLREQLRALDASAAPLLSQVRPPAAGLDAATAALKLVAIEHRREPLLADLRVVAPSAPVDGDRYAAEQDAANAALGRLRVALVAAGEGAVQVGGGFAAGLSELGLQVSPGGDPATADLVAEVHTSIQDLGPREGWFWARASGTATLRDPKSGRMLLQLDRAAKGSSTMPGEALPRAVQALADQFSRAVPGAARSWLGGP